jgi:hypothetical protein
MVHLIQADLHRKYKSETGLQTKDCDENCNKVFTELYIEWLEERVLKYFNQDTKDVETMNEFNQKMTQIKHVEGISW